MTAATEHPDVAAALRGRHFLTLTDYSADEIRYLIDLAAELKAAKREGREEQQLAGREIALIFEKDSTRTRCAFEVAAYDQGAHVTFIGPSGSHMGHKETVKDTARVLGRMYDAIEYRGFGENDRRRARAVGRRAGLQRPDRRVAPDADARRLPDDARAPATSRCEEMAFCYLGDARFNMANSYLVVGAKLGMDVRIAAPKSLWPAQELIDMANGFAEAAGGQDHDHRGRRGGGRAAATSCSPTCGSRWASPTTSGRSGSSCSMPYQINAQTMAATGNPDVKFMHCLPAFHNADTQVGKEIEEKFGMSALEVTEEVFESPASIVFDEAENRMHTIKAVMVATLGS